MLKKTPWRIRPMWIVTPLLLALLAPAARAEDPTVGELRRLNETSEAPDSDRDGLKDDVEALVGTDPEDRDSDHDGLTDSHEVLDLVPAGRGLDVAAQAPPDRDGDGLIAALDNDDDEFDGPDGFGDPDGDGVVTFLEIYGYNFDLESNEFVGVEVMTDEQGFAIYGAENPDFLAAIQAAGLVEERDGSYFFQLAQIAEQLWFQFGDGNEVYEQGLGDLKLMSPSLAVPDGQTVPYFRSHPLNADTDQDPFPDGQEVSGINMPGGVIPPGTHPLVAAYADFRILLEDYEVITLEQITTTEGKSTQEAWSNETTNELSLGLSWSVTVGTEVGVPTGATTSASATVGGSIGTRFAVSESTSGFEQEDWQQAVSTDPAAAAKLVLGIRVENSGTASAADINPTVRLSLGDEPFYVFTWPDEDDIDSLGPGQVFPSDGSTFPLGSGDEDNIVVSLDQLRSLQSGGVLTLDVLDFNDVLATRDGVMLEWAVFRADIEGVSARLTVDNGEGNIQDFYVFATDSKGPEVRLLDALLTTVGVEIDGDSVFILGTEATGWRFGFSDNAIDAVVNQLKDNGGNLLEVVLEPGWEIHLKAPGEEFVDSGGVPVISWARLSAGEVSAYATDRYEIVEAVFVDKDGEELPMELVGGVGASSSGLYLLELEEPYEPDGTESVRVTNDSDQVAVADVAFVVDPRLGYMWSGHIQKLTDSKELDSDREMSVWRVELPEGFVRLGDIASSNFGPPCQRMIVVQENDGLLQEPQDYEEIWNSKGSDMKDFSLWRPVCGSGFVALGYLANQSFDKPGTSEMRCVAESFVEPAELGEKIWDSRGGDGDEDGSMWSVKAAEEGDDGPFSVVINGFVGPRFSRDRPPELSLQALDLSKLRKMLPAGVGSLPTLRYTTTDHFDLAYSDRGTGAKRDLAVWRPSVSSSLRPLGFEATDEHREPDGRLTLMRRTEDSRESKIYRTPVRYEQTWNDKSSGGKEDGSIWQPICRAGTVALGHVAKFGYSAPDPDDPDENQALRLNRCLLDDYVVPSTIGRRIWSDSKSGARLDGSVWSIEAQEGTIAIDTFISIQDQDEAPSDDCAFNLNPALLVEDR